MKLLITRGKSRQPWRWKLLYENGEPASNSGEPFPDERHVARAVYRYLTAHDGYVILTFRGEAVRWRSWLSEAVFVKHLVNLIRTLPPERLGTTGKRKGAK